MNASELDDPDAAVMRVLYHEHAAALLRSAADTKRSIGV